MKLLLPKSNGQVDGRPQCSVSLIQADSGSRYIYCIDGVQDSLFTRAELKGAIERSFARAGFAPDDEDRTFAIYTDEGTPVGDVVDVMNVGKELKCRVILATRAE